ncbi:MAG: hypothetical protein U0231_12440 [Nitrospiraceae bacterium]
MKRNRSQACTRPWQPRRRPRRLCRRQTGCVLFQVKDNFVQAQRAERLITILRDAIIPQATLGLQAAQAGYAVGKVDFLTLLNSLLTLQDSQLELHSEMVNHEKRCPARGRYWRAVDGSERKPGS